MARGRGLRYLGLAVIAVPMMLYGATSFESDAAGADAIRIGEQSVSVEFFDRQVASSLDQIALELGVSAESAPEEARDLVVARVRDEITRELALIELSRLHGLKPTDEKLTQVIRAQPSFIVDGRFSADRFQALVGDPEAYLNQVRREMSEAIMRNSFSAAAIPARNAFEALLVHQAEKRSVRRLEIAVEVDPATEVSDEEIDFYYARNSERLFSEPELIRFEYIHVSPEAVADRVDFDEEALRLAHERRNERNLANEERRLSLLVLGSEEDAQAAKQELEQGADFAALATKRSLDLGSKEGGGDIGLISRGDLDEDISEAVFAADLGEVVGPFDSGGDWLLFEVNGVIGGTVSDFDEAREELEKQVRRNLVADEVDAVASRLDETLAGESGIEPDEVLNELGLATQLSALIELDGGTVVLPEPLDEPHLLPDLLADDIRSSGAFTSLLRRDDNTYLLARVVEYSESYVRPLDEVRDEVVEAIKLSKTLQEERAIVESQILALANGGASELDFDSAGLFEIDQFMDADELNELGLDEIVRDRLFSRQLVSSPNGLPAYSIVLNEDAKVFQLYRIDEIIPGEIPSEAQQDFLANSLARADGALMMAGYLDEALKSMNVDFNIPESESGAGTLPLRPGDRGY